ncbi:hypothetical protein OEZ85_011046 [Tetradesmus obliquus]|uniref:dTMP kinase n=1 Tax=Tetradesmus obliquus TaxID=3088 RepID=A0ABY8TPI1_TETOB|nr:hypothetical protein OEZ85_011046 [Tetradesmus obliquus]
MQQRGTFIVFEGIDRSGKSTQARLLAQALQQHGLAVEELKFPDRSSPLTGSVINSYLAAAAAATDEEDDDVHASETMQLLFSANRREKAGYIERQLQAGTTLIVDRYTYSAMAYATSVLGLGAEWCQALDTGLPQPDLVILMDLPARDAASRPGFGGERYESQACLERVRMSFLAMVEPTLWFRVIVIPYVKSSRNRVLMMIVKDKVHNEWTFVSGGCKLYETNEQSAVRELREETRAAVQVDLSACNFTRCTLATDYREPAERAHDASAKVITHYHIYLIDITAYKSIPAIVQSFRRRRGCVRGAYDETSDIQFLPLNAFARLGNVWPFIKNVVLQNPSFKYHCSTLRSLPLASAASPAVGCCC